jgi:hypothetical protein
VDLQLNALLGLDEAGQSFTADFTLTTSWTDPRLRNPRAPALSKHDPAMLRDGQIWSPRLVLANRRDQALSTEGVLEVRGRRGPLSSLAPNLMPLLHFNIIPTLASQSSMAAAAARLATVLLRGVRPPV